MKPNYIAVICLCVVLMLNIVFTQMMVHQFFYENYLNAIIFGLLNIILFPLAVIIYKKDKHRKGVS